MMNIILRSGHGLWLAFVRFHDNQGGYRAAALTYSSLLTLVPLLVAVVAILTIFPRFVHIGQQIQSFIFAHFLPTSGQVIQKYLHQFVEHAADLSKVSLSFLGVTILQMMYTVEESLNVIWKVQQRRHLGSTFGVYLGMLLWIPMVIGLGVLLKIGPIFLSIVLFTSLYRLVPACAVSWLDAFAGGLVATLLFQIAKWGFIQYAHHASTYQILYGSLAVLPLFLLWLYLVWWITLFGAEVSFIMSSYLRKNKVE